MRIPTQSTLPDVDLLSAEQAKEWERLTNNMKDLMVDDIHEVRHMWPKEQTLEDLLWLENFTIGAIRMDEQRIHEFWENNRQRSDIQENNQYNVDKFEEVVIEKVRSEISQMINPHDTQLLSKTLSPKQSLEWNSMIMLAEYVINDHIATLLENIPQEHRYKAYLRLEAHHL